MEYILLEKRAKITQEQKQQQQQQLFQNIARLLVISSAKIMNVSGEREMFDAINRLEHVEKFLQIEAGEHGACLRPGCNHKTHANLYKSEDDQIWLYRCPCCQSEKEVITFAELVIEVYKAQYPQLSHRSIVQAIRRAFDVDFSSDFYKGIAERVNYNMGVLNNAQDGSYLQKLIKKRKLDEFYEAYGEIAMKYAQEDNYDYSFYASRSAVLEHFKTTERKHRSNAVVEKINLLTDLGFISRIAFEDIPYEYRKNAKFKAVDAEIWFKDASAYQLNYITEEQLVKAEEYSKAIICNKIYRNKVSLEETINETCSFTKDEAKFLDRANKAIDDELKSKGYIALSSVVAKIDKKGKYYKKADKEKFFELLEDRILLEANVKKIKATESNKKLYNMKRVKDKEVILVKSDKESGVSDRIIVETSVRKAKQEKSESIKAKKQTPKVVETWFEGGCEMALLSNGEIDMIDIPF